MRLIAITLLQTCMIAGLPRSPVEGVQTVPEDEAERLVDSNMAEYADMGDGDEDDSIGLQSLSIKELVELAALEGVAIKSRASKPELLSAIGDHRDRVAAKKTLDEADRAKLAEIATSEGVTFSDDTNDEALREAIFAKAFPPTA